LVINRLVITSCVEIHTNNVILGASREAPVGGIWLVLFDHEEFELSYSPRKVDYQGTYRLQGDSIMLKKVGENSFRIILIKQGNTLAEMTNTGIYQLEITHNLLTP